MPHPARASFFLGFLTFFPGPVSGKVPVSSSATQDRTFGVNRVEQIPLGDEFALKASGWNFYLLRKVLGCRFRATRLLSRSGRLVALGFNEDMGAEARPSLKGNFRGQGPSGNAFLD